MKNTTLLGLSLSLLTLVGCVSGNTPKEKFHSRMRAKPAELSTFLPNHELLEKQPNHFPFHYFYFKDNGKHYDNVYIAPVDISQLRASSSWSEFDKAMAGKFGTQIDDLTDFMKKAYEQAFRASAKSSQLEVVSDKNKPNTAIVETAIVAFCPTKAEINAIGTAVNFAVPGVGIVTAAMFGGGVLTVECRIRDAATGEIISMYATTESEPRALYAPSQFTWSYSARINIKQIASYTAQVYLAARDYRKVNRRFPIRWTSLIKDAQLDEEPNGTKQ